MNTWLSLGLHYGATKAPHLSAELSPDAPQELLANQIISELGSEKGRCGFISLVKLHQLIDADQIRKLLQRSDREADSELLHQISTCCRKIFSLLLLTVGYPVTWAFIYRNAFIFIHNNPKLDDSVFQNFESNSHFLEWRPNPFPRNLLPLDRVLWSSVLGQQWVVPPKLIVDSIRKYPKDFILPLFDQEEIGQGTFGQVFKAYIGDGHLLDYYFGKLIAVKKVSDKAIEADRLHEVTTLWSRKHSHILPLLSAFVVADSPYENLFIVTPYACGGDMETWLTSESIPTNPPQLSNSVSREDFLYETMLSLLDAVAFIHSGIQDLWCGHFDIKPRNIFLFEDHGQWLWKIGDFGLSSLNLVRSRGVTHDIGTDEYHPPEYFKSSRKTCHGPPFDVYSLGCVVLQLMTLVVFPWAEGKIAAFKREFMTSKSGKSVFLFRSANVTQKWCARLLQGSSGEKAKEALGIISGMLYSPFQDRLFAFDAALDFSELLSPSMGLSDYEKCCQRLMKGQEPKNKFGNYYDPVIRAMGRSSQERQSYVDIRTRYLVENGWADKRSFITRRITNLKPSTQIRSLSTLPEEIGEEYFVGRQNVLDDIDTRFQYTSIISLFGLGGMGKSHLAWKYACRAREEASQAGHTLHTFWVRCRNMSSFEQSYGLIIRAIQRENPNRQITVKGIRKWFGELECSWILILDGVEELYPEWRNLCPYREAYTNGRILITTKDRTIARNICAQSHYAIEVSSLCEADSISLFRRFKTPSEPDDDIHAKEIVKKLHFPILIKIVAKSISHFSEAGEDICSVAHSLSNQQELIKQIGKLDVRDPRCGRRKAVKRVFRLVFDRALLRETKTRKMLALMCCFSGDAVDITWFNREFSPEITKRAFGSFTNRLYLKQNLRQGSLYSTHEIVQLLFRAQIQHNSKSPKAEIWEIYMRAICMLYVDYTERKTESPENADGAIPLQLLKLQYKDHIEEFLKYAQHPKPVLEKFWSQAALGLIVFARWFEDEGRPKTRRSLLEIILSHGITEDKGCEIELSARLDLVKSLVASARGRNTKDTLQTAGKEAKVAFDRAHGAQQNTFIWKFRREQVYLLCRSGKWDAAKEQLQVLSQTIADVREKERDIAQLDIIECEAILSGGRGQEFYHADDLRRSLNLWESLIDQLEKSSLDEAHKAERLERAWLALAEVLLTRMEGLRSEPLEEVEIIKEAKTLARKARALYLRVKTERERRYAAVARKHENHKHVIDARYSEAAGFLRIGLWNKSSAMVADYASILRKILNSYEEEAKLDSQDPDVRACAYSLGDAIEFLKDKQSSDDKHELERLIAKYSLKENKLGMRYRKLYSD